MLSVAEIERRVVRGREIVERQRQLAAKIGNDFPIAIALLAAFEKSLALLEVHHQPDVLANARDESARGSDVLQIASVPELEIMAYQKEMRDTARVLEILRSSGYECKLAEPTMQ